MGPRDGSQVVRLGSCPISLPPFLFFRQDRGLKTQVSFELAILLPQSPGKLGLQAYTAMLNLICFHKILFWVPVRTAQVTNNRVSNSSWLNGPVSTNTGHAGVGQTSGLPRDNLFCCFCSSWPGVETTPPRRKAKSCLALLLGPWEEGSILP